MRDKIRYLMYNVPKGADDGMPGTRRSYKRRNTLYVKQNKAYQVLLATLVIAFLVVTAVLMTNSLSNNPNTRWSDNVLIRMIREQNSVRYTQNE